MAHTVSKLIKHLQHLDPNEPILVQYLTAEHTLLDDEEFSAVVAYLDDNVSFYEEASDFFQAWVTEAHDVLLTVAEQDADDTATRPATNTY
jgi:hypothetical protein